MKYFTSPDSSVLKNKLYLLNLQMNNLYETMKTYGISLDVRLKQIYFLVSIVYTPFYIHTHTYKYISITLLHIETKCSLNIYVYADIYIYTLLRLLYISLSLSHSQREREKEDITSVRKRKEE